MIPCKCPRKIFVASLGWETKMLWVLWVIALPSGIPLITMIRLRWGKLVNASLQPLSNHISLFPLMVMTRNSGNQYSGESGPGSSNCWSASLSLGPAPWLTHIWCIEISSLLSIKSVVHIREPVVSIGALTAASGFLLLVLLWRSFLLTFEKPLVGDVRGT